jgi:2-oxoglutarate/2-oxoacid ferredoxin oxidoreductase subunit alpha
MESIYAYLNKNFSGKTKVVESNFNIAKAAFDWCAANTTKTDPYSLQRMDATKGKILIDGNMAGALGGIYGGCTVVAWYPITPATSLADGLVEWMPKLRQDKETGKATFAIVQAEDELAAIGMLIGAAPLDRGFR